LTESSKGGNMFCPNCSQFSCSWRCEIITCRDLIIDE
jgi:hypothetical protein